jgi:hypothetical protein
MCLTLQRYSLSMIEKLSRRHPSGCRSLLVAAERLESAELTSLANSAPSSMRTIPRTTTKPVNNTRKKALLATSVAQVLHDGYMDLIYVMLPIWQAQFGIGSGWLAVMRALYLGTAAGLQLPSNRLAERFGSKTILLSGTVIAAIGYGLAGLSGGLFGLCAALTLAGSGSSTQHPIGAGIVSQAYGQSARGPLGIYNFAGGLLNTAEGNAKRQGLQRARYFDDGRGSAWECAARWDASVAKRINKSDRTRPGKELLARIVAMWTRLVERFDPDEFRVREDGINA